MVDQITQNKNARSFSKKNAINVSEYGYYDDMNRKFRQNMEDAFIVQENFLNDQQQSSGIYAVLDGHGGNEVSDFVSQSFIKLFKKEYNDKDDVRELFEKVFRKQDEQLVLVGASDQGTCCCVVLVRQEQNNKMCYVANLGDTRAVLNLSGRAQRVSKDHKATDPSEIQRVTQSGGNITKNRVDGQLAVTRALGDLQLKKKGVICVPDVNSFQISNQTQYLIIASDGLWDVVEDQKAIDLIANAKLTDTAQISKYLVEYAIQNGSQDNTSVFVLKF